MKTITLRSWIDENELHLNSEVSEEIMDTEGAAYADKNDCEWWACPLLIVQTDTTGTRVLDEEDEERVREWIDEDNNRPSDLSKPDTVTYGS